MVLFEFKQVCYSVWENCLRIDGALWTCYKDWMMKE